MKEFMTDIACFEMPRSGYMLLSRRKLYRDQMSPFGDPRDDFFCFFADAGGSGAPMMEGLRFDISV